MATDPGDLVQPPAVPADFWSQGDMRAALATRQMGRVIRAYRQHPHHGRRGVSQDDMATWSGMSQGWISQMENGPPINQLDRLTFWALLLGIPQEHLWFDLPGEPGRVDGVQSGAGPQTSVLAVGTSSATAMTSLPGSHEELDSDPLAAERAAALGPDLWELHDALQARRVSSRSLALAEEACARLDSRYAELPPLVLLPELRRQLKHVVGWLQEPQPVAFRRRLCSLAGRLAGLRGWLYFDMADHEAADVWFAGAATAASEADDYDLCGWLVGSRSLIPVDRQDFVVALEVLEEAQGLAGRGASATTRAWLDALEGRALAGLGDERGFGASRARAAKRLPRTKAVERHHGMDFAGAHLDPTYYEGLSFLLLGKPEAAATSFRTALDNLPPTRVKARSILMLSVALAAARARQLDEAVALVGDALSLASDQPIRRAWQRAAEVRATLEPVLNLPAVRRLDDQLEAFANSLEPVGTS